MNEIKVVNDNHYSDQYAMLAKQVAVTKKVNELVECVNELEAEGKIVIVHLNVGEDDTATSDKTAKEVYDYYTEGDFVYGVSGGDVFYLDNTYLESEVYYADFVRVEIADSGDRRGQLTDIYAYKFHLESTNDSNTVDYTTGNYGIPYPYESYYQFCFGKWDSEEGEPIAYFGDISEGLNADGHNDGELLALDSNADGGVIFKSPADALGADTTDNGKVLTAKVTGTAPNQTVSLDFESVDALPTITSGDAGKVLTVNAGETGAEWSALGGGATAVEVSKQLVKDTDFLPLVKGDVLYRDVTMVQLSNNDVPDLSKIAIGPCKTGTAVTIQFKDASDNTKNFTILVNYYVLWSSATLAYINARLTLGSEPDATMVAHVGGNAYTIKAFYIYF